VSRVELNRNGWSSDQIGKLGIPSRIVAFDVAAAAERQLEFFNRTAAEAAQRAPGWSTRSAEFIKEAVRALPYELWIKAKQHAEYRLDGEEGERERLRQVAAAEEELRHAEARHRVTVRIEELPAGGLSEMPTVAIVEGARIMFYWNDHPPPHFHVEFAGGHAQISIETVELIEGSLAPAKLATIKSWAASRQKELMECWDKARKNEHPGKVE
jgi:hypothetical protein